MQLLFEGDYYLGCSFYSNKYGVYIALIVIYIYYEVSLILAGV